MLWKFAYCCRYSIVRKIKKSVDVLQRSPCYRNFPWEKKFVFFKTFSRWTCVDMHIDQLVWFCSIDWCENLVEIRKFFRWKSGKKFGRKCMLFVTSELFHRKDFNRFVGSSWIWYQMKEQRFLYRMKLVSIEKMRIFPEKIRIYSENLLNSSMFFSLFSTEEHANFDSIADFFVWFDRKRGFIPMGSNIFFVGSICVSRTVDEGKEREENRNKAMS